MKIKKMLAEALIAAMMLSTVPFYVFAEDDADVNNIETTEVEQQADEQSEETAVSADKKSDADESEKTVNQPATVLEDNEDTSGNQLLWDFNIVPIDYADGKRIDGAAVNHKRYEDKSVESVTVDLPEVKGYHTTSGQTTYTVNKYERKATFMIYYVKNQYTVNVHFLKDDKEFDSQTYTAAYGDTVKYTCPKVEGYEPPSYEAESNPIEVDTEIYVDYSKKQYRIIVHYVDKNGRKLAADTIEQAEYMGYIQIDNPVVKGYKADSDGISISNITENMEVSVVYAKIKDKNKDKDKDSDKDSKKSDSPETGDESSLMVFLMMLLGSMMGIFALRRKNS